MYWITLQHGDDMLNRAQVHQLAHLKRKLFNGIVMYTDDMDQSFSDSMVKYIKSNIPDTIAPKNIKILAEELKWKMNNKKGTVKLDAVVGNNYFAVMLPDDLFLSKKSCLDQLIDIFVEKKSCWYISDPIPISDQPKYFNSVIVARTSLWLGDNPLGGGHAT